MSTPREFGTTPRDDVDLDDDIDLVDAPPTSDLDDIAAELEADVDLDPTITLAVPGRPAYAVEYRTDIAARQLEGWRRKARDKSYADGIDPAKFAALAAANTCKAILRNGAVIELDDKPATFAARDFQDALTVASSTDAVRRLYGNRDASIIAAAQAIIAAAGYEDVALAVDPQ